MLVQLDVKMLKKLTQSINFEVSGSKFRCVVCGVMKIERGAGDDAQGETNPLFLKQSENKYCFKTSLKIT